MMLVEERKQEHPGGVAIPLAPDRKRLTAPAAIAMFQPSDMRLGQPAPSIIANHRTVLTVSQLLDRCESADF